MKRGNMTTLWAKIAPIAVSSGKSSGAALLFEVWDPGGMLLTNSQWAVGDLLQFAHF
jgi:hypothetical protein